VKRLLTILLVFVGLNVFATPPTTYYVSLTNDDWETAATWDQGSAPTWNQTMGSDDITINTNVLLTSDINVKSGTVITINVGDTLTIDGNAQFNNGCTINVNGVLIITGSVANNNNSDGVVINGTLIINGDYDGGNGSDLVGSGGMEIDGAVTTAGDATVFGSDTDCTVDCDNSDADPLGDPLPIELLWFTATMESEYVIIEWATGSEINNDYFEVYTLVNKVWEKIGIEKGAGNSSSVLMYKMEDYRAQYGYNYYQLRQVDFDGKTETFKMISYYRPYDLMIKDMKIYPNPSSSDSQVNVELIGFTGEEVLIIVMDPLGQIFYEKAIITHDGQNIIVIDSKLTEGTYLVIGSEKQELYRKKLIIR
jgi:hypothetical protein